MVKQLFAKDQKKRKNFTERQLEVRRKFSLAAQYAKNHMKHPELKAFYETGINSKKNSAYSVAVSDFLTPPTIPAIRIPLYKGSLGKRILIEAVDDFKVVSVSVRIETPGSIVVESGDAERIQSCKECWLYAITKSHDLHDGTRISVTVSDFAGNITTKTVTIDAAARTPDGNVWQ